MEYQLIRDFEDGLEDKVNKAIGEGWEPLGGVTVLHHDNPLFDFAYAQAMVRESKGDRNTCGWIPLKKAQPKFGEKVLVTDGRDILTGEYTLWKNFGPSFIIGQNVERSVTHWMPLPDLPGEGRENDLEVS